MWIMVLYCALKLCAKLSALPWNYKKLASLSVFMCMVYHQKAVKGLITLHIFMGMKYCHINILIPTLYRKIVAIVIQLI